ARQRREPVVLVGHANIEGDVAALDEAHFAQALAECANVVGVHPGAVGEISDYRHRRLLRARRERPRSCLASDERDELAAVHSITSSARASSVGGTSRPSALAVVRLMTRSNLVGCTTGTSAFAPLRMRSTYDAERRTMSTLSGP